MASTNSVWGMNTDTVKTKAAEMMSIASDINTTLTSIQSAITGDLSTAWVSDAASSYISKFEELKADFDIFYNNIQLFNQDVESAATIAQSSDDASNIAA